MIEPAEAYGIAERLVHDASNQVPPPQLEYSYLSVLDARDMLVVLRALAYVTWLAITGAAESSGSTAALNHPATRADVVRTVFDLCRETRDI